MSRVSSNKTAAPKKSGSSLLAGILMGMVVGVALAAGVAWFILKSPSPFVNKESGARPVVEPEKPVVAKPSVAGENSVAGVKNPEAAAKGPEEESKPRFEFYKVLTDKPDAAVYTPSAPVEKPKVEAVKPTYLQAGAFSNPSDAESLKATLAMKGLVASVQTVSLQGRGDMHRVRVGPFQNEREMNGVRATLKTIGIDAAPVR